MTELLQMWRDGSKRQVVYHLFRSGSSKIAEFAILLHSESDDLEEFHRLLGEYDKIQRRYIEKAREAIRGEVAA